MAKYEEILWEFIRGDLEPASFEQWVYATDDLENYFDKQTYLKLISSGYSSAHALLEVKEMLCEWLETHSQRRCDCITWANLQVIPLTYDNRPETLLAGFSVLKEAEQHVQLIRCRSCGQQWCVAIDWMNDDWHFKRLSAEICAQILETNYWPFDFQLYQESGRPCFL
jgi:hypothetical protein